VTAVEPQARPNLAISILQSGGRRGRRRPHH
jgi:hypothetical protein